MAFIHTAVDPDGLRKACGIPDATEITVYDADFPAEAGQQFVEAMVVSSVDEVKEFDLTDPKWWDLNDLIEQEAEAANESVKFILDLIKED